MTDKQLIRLVLAVVLLFATGIAVMFLSLK